MPQVEMHTEKKVKCVRKCVVILVRNEIEKKNSITTENFQKTSIFS